MRAVHGASDRLFSPSWLDGIQFGARSHIGRRKENQDELRLPAAVENRDGRGPLFAVADGMGGHQGAGIASRIACKGLAEYHARRMSENGRLSAVALRRHMAATIYRIDRRIRLEGRKNPALEEMGTTLSSLVLTSRHSIIAHVGDSRIYCLRGGYLTRLTTDHTFVQDMIFEGEVTLENAAAHPLRHLLTRAVGTMEPLEWVDTRIDPRRPEDRYLLCTDGLFNAVNDGRLAALLSSDADASGAATKLVDEALQKGARDNVTAIVIIPSSNVSAKHNDDRKRI